MDPGLYKLLPSGGEFWIYKNTNVEKFIQKIYISIEEQPGPVYVPEQEPTPVSAPVSVPVSAPVSAPELEIKIDNIQVEVFEYILTKIDNIYPMYPSSLKDIAQKALKVKLEEILTSPDGQLFFGSRKTRSIMAWLSGNIITDSSEPIISGFLSFILDEIIISDKKKIEGDYNWILHKVPSKKRRENIWVLKNDKT